MSDDFPVFDLNGKMLGNMTTNQGQIPNSLFSVDWSTIPEFLPQVTSKFAPSATSNGNVVTANGGANGDAGATSNGAPTNAAGTPSNAQATGAASSVVSGSIADYFLRGVIIILGFIFVTIGLNMFRPGTIQAPRIGAG